MNLGYPESYRAREVAEIAAAARAGECASVVGLSGAGKSNLLAFLAERQPAAGCTFVLVDCNRLPEQRPAALFQLARRALAPGGAGAVAGDVAGDEPFAALDDAAGAWLRAHDGVLCLLLDRLDDLVENAPAGLFNNLRALRDAHKFRLVYVTGTRRPLPAHNEFAELFHAHVVWLGPLAESDARWNVARYAARQGLAWDDNAADALVRASWAYPSLLRAACEAYAAGVPLDALGEHAAVRARAAEFWSDTPSAEHLRLAGLAGQPWLAAAAPRAATVANADAAQLTAKEHLLLVYLQAHAGQVCEKDDLIRAVWPEDRIFERGVRDDSLAQLVRRLREKIESDPAHPRLVLTVPGRGYRFAAAAAV